MIKVKNICKSYSTGIIKTEVVKGVSLSVNEGEFVVILGPSGSGKSTLLYLMGLLENLDNGNIIVNDTDISVLSSKAKSDFRLNNIGFVFQAYNLVQGFSVLDNVLIPVMLSGKSVKEYEKIACKYLQEVGLYDKRNKYPNELSGGEQQRVAIARALIMNPRIILADEPTGNLDTKTGTEILHLLKRLNQEKKCTIIMVTHNQEVIGYADRIIWFKDGVIDKIEVNKNV